MLADRRCLEHSQRDSRCPLLAGGTEQPQLTTVDGELEIVAVRTDVRKSTLDVESALFLERSEEHIVPSFRFCKWTDVAHHGTSLFANHFRQTCEFRSRLLYPPRSALNEDSSVLGQCRLPHRDAFVGGPAAATGGVAKRGVAAHEIGAVMLKGIQIALVGESQDEIDVAAPLRRSAAHQIEVAR